MIPISQCTPALEVSAWETWCSFPAHRLFPLFRGQGSAEKAGLRPQVPPYWHVALKCAFPSPELGLLQTAWVSRALQSMREPLQMAVLILETPLLACRSGRPGFISSSFSDSMQPWAGCLTSLNLSFFICRMGKERLYL